jgi:hypothetical protein
MAPPKVHNLYIIGTENVTDINIKSIKTYSMKQ